MGLLACFCRHLPPRHTGVYQHGLFGLFNNFPANDVIRTFVGRVWLQQNHATNPLKWKLSNVKTTLLALIIAMFIIMFGDIDVTPNVIITMPELLVQYFCIVWQFCAILYLGLCKAQSPSAHSTVSSSYCSAYKRSDTLHTSSNVCYQTDRVLCYRSCQG